jgi:hypothetical protein
MAQSIPSIPPLITDGINTRIVYAKYRVGVKDAAIAIPAPFTNACYGIVEHLVPESEYLALRGVTSAMPTLVCPHEATPSDCKKFAAEVAAIASFKLALYNSLPCELRSLIGGSGGQSVHEVELSTILATLDAKFKALKPADIQCLLTNLCVPYVYPQPCIGHLRKLPHKNPCFTGSQWLSHAQRQQVTILSRGAKAMWPFSGRYTHV